MPKTDVKVKLVGTDGNVFSIIGKVAQSLRRGGYKELADEFENKALNADTYNQVLGMCFEYVEVS